MDTVTDELSDIAEEARTFLEGFQSLQLATAQADAAPVASYAPFAFSNRGGYYIYVSELAPHTRNLLASKECATMFLEDEKDAANIFARRRITTTCEVRYLPRGEAAFETALTAMAQRFGEIVDYLKTLTDFHAFELVPRHAGYVKGFAQAYDFPGADFDRIRHINDKGHDDSK